MSWELSEGVLSQVRLETVSKSAIRLNLFSPCNHSVCALCVCIHRQVCDLWEPQGQLGSRCHRPEQWDVSHVGIDQSVGKDGKAG